ISKSLEDAKVPLLDNFASTVRSSDGQDVDDQDQYLARRLWIESKKLWHIVGPSIFSRMASYSMFVITQASAGHLGNLELAGISIATNVIIGFDFGLLRSWIVLFVCCVLLLPLYLCASLFLKLLGQPPEVAELSGLVAMWMIPLHFSFAFQFPLQRFLQSQMKAGVIAWVSLLALVVHLIVSWLFVYKLKLGVVGTAATLNFSWWVLTMSVSDD
ncbi:protein detoxification 28, partial [Quercus suber]